MFTCSRYVHAKNEHKRAAVFTVLFTVHGLYIALNMNTANAGTLNGRVLSIPELPCYESKEHHGLGVFGVGVAAVMGLGVRQKRNRT